MFHRFSQTGTVVALGQGEQGQWVGDNRGRWMKGADQVLTSAGVHPGFTPYRRVQHRQQRGGHLQVGHTAHVSGGDKSGQIAGHSTTECDDAAISAETMLEQCVCQAGPRFTRL
jgi:hypothetical protein